jgi:hypothetical protein
MNLSCTGPVPYVHTNFTTCLEKRSFQCRVKPFGLHFRLKLFIGLGKQAHPGNLWRDPEWLLAPAGHQLRYLLAVLSLDLLGQAADADGEAEAVFPLEVQPCDLMPIPWKGRSVPLAVIVKIFLCGFLKILPVCCRCGGMFLLLPLWRSIAFIIEISRISMLSSWKCVPFLFCHSTILLTVHFTADIFVYAITMELCAVTM